MCVCVCVLSIYVLLCISIVTCIECPTSTSQLLVSSTAVETVLGSISPAEGSLSTTRDSEVTIPPSMYCMHVYKNEYINLIIYKAAHVHVQVHRVNVCGTMHVFVL